MIAVNLLSSRFNSNPFDDSGFRPPFRYGFGYKPTIDCTASNLAVTRFAFPSHFYHLLSMRGKMA
jgi:hypothetical protein